jgi:hypothetical protein
MKPRGRGSIDAANAVDGQPEANHEHDADPHLLPVGEGTCNDCARLREKSSARRLAREEAPDPAVCGVQMRTPIDRHHLDGMSTGVGGGVERERAEGLEALACAVPRSTNPGSVDQ